MLACFCVRVCGSEGSKKNTKVYFVATFFALLTTQHSQRATEKMARGFDHLFKLLIIGDSGELTCDSFGFASFSFPGSAGWLAGWPIIPSRGA